MAYSEFAISVMKENRRRQYPYSAASLRQKLFNAVNADSLKITNHKTMNFDLSEIRDDNQNSLMHAAIEYSSYRWLLYLLDNRKMDANLKNKNGKTPLDLALEIAARNNYFFGKIRTIYDVINLLISHGAQANIKILSLVQTFRLLRMALKQDRIDHARVITHLLPNSFVGINYIDFDANTLLHTVINEACRMGEEKAGVILELLLKQEKINIDLENSRGETPLVIAQRKKYPSLVSLLQNHRAENKAGSSTTNKENQQAKSSNKYHPLLLSSIGSSEPAKIAETPSADPSFRFEFC